MIDPLPMRNILHRGLFAFSLVAAAYLVLLAYPQPLFAYQLNHAGITVHATTPIPDAMRTTLDRVRARLDRTPLVDPSQPQRVFICSTPWLFTFFARNNYRVGGVADVFVGQNVFLRQSDMASDRLISPGGQPVAADRPLSYFMTHELMHIAQARHLGRLRYARLPQWTDDGYADYVARDYDLAVALQKLKDDAPELDPNRSGLYIRYHLMVAYLIEKRGMDVSTLLERPPKQSALERQLAGLPTW